MLADWGFLIEKTIGASLYIPAFTKRKDQLSASEIEKNKKYFIIVERINTV